MEFEQIIKRLEWLDEEHRKDKAAIEALLDRLAKTENELKVANKKVKGLETDMTRLTTVSARIEQFDGVLAQQRKESTKYIDEVERKRIESQQEADKRHQIQLDGVNKSIADMHKKITAEVERKFASHEEEEIRHRKLLSEWETRMEAMVKTAEEVQRAQKVADEAHRQDSKRLADLQGDVGATRKRMDEFREKTDLNTDGVRRIEIRLNEMLASESERRQAQTNFLETQASFQVERDRTTKEFEERLATLRSQTETMDQQMREWEASQRSVTRARETYDDIAQKFERRINEITEMQRLAEDRLRQELVTFKADDQKRWSSYILSQDEVHKDTHTGVEKMEQRLTVLEDLTQTQQDIIQQTKDANEQLFQGMLAQIHELLAAYERIMSVK